MTTARDLRLVVEGRSVGLSDPMISMLIDHMKDSPSDVPRAYALADAVRAVSGSSMLLGVLLGRGVTVEQFVITAARHVNHQWRISPRSDLAIRAEFGG